MDGERYLALGYFAGEHPGEDAAVGVESGEVGDGEDEGFVSMVGVVGCWCEGWENGDEGVEEAEEEAVEEGSLELCGLDDYCNGFLAGDARIVSRDGAGEGGRGGALRDAKSVVETSALFWLYLGRLLHCRRHDERKARRLSRSVGRLSGILGVQEGGWMNDGEGFLVEEVLTIYSHRK